MQVVKNRAKKIIAIVICICIIMLTLSTKVLGIANSGESSEDVTGSKTKFKNYTIEDVIYNKIPMLDVNIFSTTLGGQAVVDNSIAGKIKNIVSVWYVTFRNIAIIALTMILIYAGIRIAISTVASEKAKYKEMLIGWVKSLVILLLMHYLMIIILNANEMFVSLMEKSNQNLGKLYDTIQSRAYDVRFSIGVPGTIMYAILVIFFIRFIIVYFRRYFTVMILIVIAPFIAIKYALDSLKKKGGPSFNKWIYDFSINVFMQSIHALIYTALVSIAADLAVKNIWGFIIALLLMQFMFKASKLFTQIFKFSGGSEIGKGAGEFSDDGKIFKPLTTAKEVMLPLAIAGGVTKTVVGGVAGAGGYLIDNTAVGQKVKNKVIDTKDDAMNKLDTKVGKRFAKSLTKKHPELGAEMTRVLDLRINSRQRGIRGKAAKKTLHKYRETYRKSFTSNYKFVKDVALGTAGMVLAVPAMFAYEDASVGIALWESGKKSTSKYKNSKKKRKYKGKDVALQIATGGVYGNIIKYSDNRQEDHEKSKKKYTKLRSTIDYVNKENILMDKVDEQFKNFDTPEDLERAKEEISKVNNLNVNSYSIKKKIESYIKENEITRLDTDATNDIMELVLKDAHIKEKFGENTKNDIMRVAQSAINNVNYENQIQQNSQNDFIANQISDTIVSNVTDNRYKEIIVGINQMKDINEQCKSETKNNIFDSNKYIQEQGTNIKK